jgi:hypothetical protein
MKPKAKGKAMPRQRPKTQATPKLKSKKKTGSKAQGESTKKNASSSDIARRNLIRSWLANCKKIIAGKYPAPIKSLPRMPSENYRDSEGPVFGSWLEICYLGGELEAEVRSRNVEAAKVLIESAIHLTTAISRLARDGNKSICRAASQFTEIPVMCGPHPDSIECAKQMIDLTRTGTKAQMAVAPQMKNGNKIKSAFSNLPSDSQSHREHLGEYIKRAYSSISFTRSQFVNWKGDIPDLAKRSLNLPDKIWTWKELAWEFVCEIHGGVPPLLAKAGLSKGERYKRESKGPLNWTPRVVQNQVNNLARSRFYGAWAQRYKQPTD